MNQNTQTQRENIMKTLTPSSLTLSLLSNQSVIVEGGSVYSTITTGNCNGFANVVFSCKQKVVQYSKGTYSVGFKCRKTGVIAKKETYKTLKELKISLTA